MKKETLLYTLQLREYWNAKQLFGQFDPKMYHVIVTLPFCLSISTRISDSTYHYKMIWFLLSSAVFLPSGDINNPVLVKIFLVKTYKKKKIENICITNSLVIVGWELSELTIICPTVCYFQAQIFINSKLMISNRINSDPRLYVSSGLVFAGIEVFWWPCVRVRDIFAVSRIISDP